jgi:hypothetical protein
MLLHTPRLGNTLIKNSLYFLTCRQLHILMFQTFSRQTNGEATWQDGEYGEPCLVKRFRCALVIVMQIQPFASVTHPLTSNIIP